jgi:hypothetical protein
MTTTPSKLELRDYAIRAGASELVEDCIKNNFNPGEPADFEEWVNETFDANCIGVLSDDAWQEAVWERLHDEINEAFYQFIRGIQHDIYDKASLSIKSLHYDKSSISL